MKYSAPGVTGFKAAKGAVIWTPTRRRAVGDNVVLPLPVKVTLVDGEATVSVAPTGADWIWKVEERFHGMPLLSPGKMATGIAYYAVPNTAEVFLTDLVEVDPRTLDPLSSADPAWWAMARTTVTAGEVVDGSLVLTRSDGTSVNAGVVRGLDGAPGPQGLAGPQGPEGSAGVDGHNPITVSATAPTTPADGDIWFDIS